MCTGHTIRMTVAAVTLLTGGATLSLGEKLQQPQPEDRLGRILNDWELRSSTRTSLDIRFKGIERDKAWGEEFILVGRVVLLPKARGLVEVVKYDKDRKVGESDRCVWTNDAMHQIRPEQKPHRLADRARQSGPSPGGPRVAVFVARQCRGAEIAIPRGAGE